MANRGWNNSRNPYPHNNAQIACRFCNQIFSNREAIIAHIDSHLARDEVHNNLNNNNVQTYPKASPRDQAFLSHQLASVPNNNLQQVNRNVFGTRPLAPEVNRNVLESRPPVPQVNRNGSHALSLMQKICSDDFNNLPLLQQVNNRVNVANTHQSLSWTNQPRPGPSVTPPAPPPPRRNPSLLTYVPPSAPAGSLQPAQLGFSSSTTTTRRKSTRGGATRRQRSQQRDVEEVAATTMTTTTTTEQTTRPFIDMLEKPIKKVDFIDLDNMEEDDESAGSRKKLDLALKL